MAEVKTPPVKATHIPDKEAFQASFQEGRVPGSFRVVEDGADITFWYCCPCGCASLGPLDVGRNRKPIADHATWEWNGSFDAPTLSPSVHHVGHWHGWLRNGVWEVA